MKNDVYTVLSGYEILKNEVEADCDSRGGIWKSNAYWNQFNWVLNRANHYAEITGLSKSTFLNFWEEDRKYWYMNYYSEENQPSINSKMVKVFETESQMLESLGKSKFLCPNCNSYSTSPLFCIPGNVEVCKLSLKTRQESGIYVFIEESMLGIHILEPISWEM